jgi:HEPN domain-containing protein
MIYRPQKDIPETHEVRRLFRTLAERGMSQLRSGDRQIVQYLADMLTEFVHASNLKRIASDSGERLEYVSEMLGETMRQVAPEVRRAHFKHIGDVALFELGMFPERLSYGRRFVSPS